MDFLFLRGYIVKKFLGRVTEDIAIKNDIKEYANKRIVLYDNDRRHCEKRHAHEFKNIDDFNYVMDNLDIIINNPDYVFYVKNKNTLEYYKSFKCGITVRVRVEPRNELKVKTVFTVNEYKIKNRIAFETYNKYVISEETAEQIIGN